MITHLPKLSTSTSSSLHASIPLETKGEYLGGYRASAYVKYRHSDKGAAIFIEAKVIPERQCVELFCPMKEIGNLRPGQHIYFIELVKGQMVQSFSGYIDILP